MAQNTTVAPWAAEAPGAPYPMTIDELLALSGSGAYEQLGVVCPFCTRGRPNEVSYVHLMSARTHPGNDNYEAAHHFEIGVRGDVTILRFSSAASTIWTNIARAGKAGKVKRVGGSSEHAGTKAPRR